MTWYVQDPNSKKVPTGGLDYWTAWRGRRPLKTRDSRSQASAVWLTTGACIHLRDLQRLWLNWVEFHPNESAGAPPARQLITLPTTNCRSSCEE